MAQSSEADLDGLLDRLKKAQRDLIVTAAKAGTLPSDGALRKISELEGAIAATEALLQEEQHAPQARR
ncbi:hypothetical protein [Azorhizobium]|jgi:hypothetical protein|nr:hypothetical protein [Azorhizobium]TDU00662.1 hypothetical protein DFO45_0163 [Azorhizobium sp. AG788]